MLEVNGELNVLLKAQKQNLTPMDMGQTPKPTTLSLPVISDGKVIEDTLKSFEINRSELDRILERQRVKLSDIFLMTIDKDLKTEIIKKRY